MLTYESSASINAALEIVWRALSDVTHWDHWTPTVTKVQALDQSELGLGNRFKVHQPDLRPAIWSVTAIQTPSSFTWESRSPGMVMIAEHTLQRSAAGRTELTLRFSFRGVLGAIFGRLSKSLVEGYLATEAVSLRRHVEALSGISQSAASPCPPSRTSPSNANSRDP